MFGINLAEVAAGVQGQLLSGDPLLQPAGAAIDSREIKAGDLFFAMPGAKTDGHAFLTQARDRGAIAAVITDLAVLDQGLEGFPLIVVKDAEKALQQLASIQRRSFSGSVIAITGSTGKTTTKDLLTAILAQRGPVLSTVGNYNNQLGLPLTILALQKNHWALITEMGMRGLGEIDFLAAIARPTYGIITNIGHTHQELLGSVERIAQAKAELISHIPVGGGMALNLKDKPLLKPWLSNLRCPVTWCSFKKPADLWVEKIQINETLGYDYEICSPDNRCFVSLPIPGRHNIINSLGPSAIARYLGLDWELISRGLSQARLSAMRLEAIQVPARDLLVINDAYNANPDSVASALEVLTSAAGSRRTVAVLGDMYELGDYAPEGHRLVGRRAKEQGIAYLITVGQLAEQIAAGAKEAQFPEEKIRSCQNNQEALSYLKDILQPADVVLIKGSRGVKMEEIVAGLQAL